jgi:hypothetical protein
MKTRLALIVASCLALAVAFATCVSKKSSSETAATSGGTSNAPTRVQVQNAGTGTTTVTLTAPAPFTSQTAIFNSVPSGTTSAYQNLTFDSYSGVSVSCSAAGCLTQTVIINRNADNIIHVKDGLEPAANPNGTAPTVSTVSPADGATSVSTNSSVVVTFSEPMFTTTLTTNTANTTCSGSIQVSTVANNFASCVQMTAAPSASGDSTQFTVTPNGGLAASTQFKVRVTTAARDKTDVAMAAQYTMTNFFTSGTLADNTFPAAVTLTSPGKTSTSVDLSWTDTGDDNNTGNATSYQLRYSTATITTGNFTSASLHSSGTPSAPGTNRSATVSGLSASITYHFMYRICDEVPNCTYSNNLQVTTDAAPTTTTTGGW